MPGGFQHSAVSHMQWPGPVPAEPFKRWLGVSAHALRESWRRQRMEAFLSMDRRDSSTLRLLRTRRCLST